MYYILTIIINDILNIDLKSNEIEWKSPIVHAKYNESTQINDNNLMNEMKLSMKYGLEWIINSKLLNNNPNYHISGTSGNRKYFVYLTYLLSWIF